MKKTIAQCELEIRRLKSRLRKCVVVLDFYASGSWDGIKTPKFILDKGDLARYTLVEIGVRDEFYRGKRT